MSRAGVPTAAYEAFTDEQACCDYVRKLGGPVVVKADGLAAGKGVIVASTTEEALAGVHECFTAFGDAGSVVVVEEMLEGPECSLLALTDGKTVVPLATSQDHKRALDGDRGPNTGGMGVYSPVPILLPGELEQMVEIEEKVVAQLAAEGNPYSGCLYGGFMLTKDGPKVLEFNASRAPATPAPTRRASASRASPTPRPSTASPSTTPAPASTTTVIRSPTAAASST